MYVVQCMFGCGTFVAANGNKPQLRWCGTYKCADKAQDAKLEDVEDFYGNQITVPHEGGAESRYAHKAS